MTYVRGYGSTPYVYSSTSTGQDVSIETSGECVVDGVLLSSDGASTDFDLVLQNAAGSTIKTWEGIDNTNAGAIRDGYYCGQFGLRSSGGLKFSITNAGGLLVSIIICYRKVFG